MANENLRNNSESLATYLVLKKLVAPITSFEAYKLNLIDSSGNIIKVPETEEEKNSLGMLDRLCLQLKKIIGTKMSIFKDFLYLLNTEDDYLNKLNGKNSALKRAEIIRIDKELKKLTETYDISMDYFLCEILKEKIKSEV